ncbi:hypothetical protein ACFPOG_12465 [Paenibacillus aestuarii]|uniref:PadR family transcriptional regulator n=1 Tax=Paenibacillus aestuarii TaxID=516965 RepID=A0ABW0K8C3_9BACL
MPNKEDMKLSPNQLGLTQREIMYIFVFKMLSQGSSHPAELFSQLQERVPQDFLKSRTNFYAAMEEMVKFGWITFVTEGRRKNFSIASPGAEKMQWYKNTYYIPLSSVKVIANSLITKITGSSRDPVPESAKQHAKLFNRLINVRDLVIFFFLEALHRTKDLTAKEVYDIIRQEYGWNCSEGYIYELAHELEGEVDKTDQTEERIPLIKGEWEGGRRRRNYRYRLTHEGLQMRTHAGDTALTYIKNVHRYLRAIVELLQEDLITAVE